MDTSLMMVGVSFNSKLVRLEVMGNAGQVRCGDGVSIPNWFDQKTVGGSIEVSAGQFQFQTGSIRRDDMFCMLQSHESVSIPNWFDQKSISWSTNVSVMSVSIPNWFDQKNIDMTKNSLTRTVSIPNWFDQKIEVTPPPCFICSFQFQTGSIRRFSLLLWTGNAGFVSIPNWFDQKVGKAGAALGVSGVFQFQTGSIRRHLPITI